MQLTRKFNKIISQKEKRLKIVRQQYQHCLEDNSKQLTKLLPCLQQTRTVLHKIDSADIILTSSDLTKRYNLEISSAIKNSNIPLAKLLLTDWHTLEKREINQRTQLEKQLLRKDNNKKQIPSLPTSSDKQTPPDTVSDQSVKSGSFNQFITQLLNQAEQQHAKKQLTTPDGDNAWQTYQDILNLDSGNNQALLGINKITKTYVLWAREEIKRDNLQHAEFLFSKALKVNPNDNEAFSGFAQLSMKKLDSQQKKSSVETPPIETDRFLIQPSSKVTELLNKAKQQITKKQLMTPSKGNAWKTYKEVLRLDSGNKQALIGINKIATIYIQRARGKLEKGNFKHAGYLFNKALVVSPRNREALSGLDQLDRLRE
jgi:tetratricopeptide (TPR) repeat protein